MSKPAYLKGLLWFTFSGTAMASAFLLPAHFWALQTGLRMNLNSPILRIYFFFVFFCALFHSLYRVKTICFDLGLKKYRGMTDIGVLILFLLGMIVAAWILFGIL